MENTPAESEEKHFDFDLMFHENIPPARREHLRETDRIDDNRLNECIQIPIARQWLDVEE